MLIHIIRCCVACAGVAVVYGHLNTHKNQTAATGALGHWGMANVNRIDNGRVNVTCSVLQVWVPGKCL